MEVIVRVRQDGVEGDLFLHDLEDDIRHGRVPPTAELKYAPWTGDRFLPMGSLEALADAFGSPSGPPHFVYFLEIKFGDCVFPPRSTVLFVHIPGAGVIREL